MRDVFCRQCSLENFDHDYRDLAGIGGDETLVGLGYPVRCAGCGNIRVDNEGICLGGKGCTRGHHRIGKTHN